MAEYIVKSGDTLAGIAAKHPGVTVAAIAQANGITNLNFIRVGQRLTISSPGVVAGAGVGVLTGADGKKSERQHRRGRLTRRRCWGESERGEKSNYR